MQKRQIIKRNSLFILLIFCMLRMQAQDSLHLIRIDQEGYYPKAPKIAIEVAGKEQDPVHPSEDFYVIRDKNQDTVFRGKLSATRTSLNSGIHTRIADFTPLEKPGIYSISVPGAGKSYPFSIRENVHRPLAESSLKAFYYQRASMPLELRFAGKWARSAGHPDDSVLIHPSAVSEKRSAGSVISVPGGWYDAGDYNKYIVNSGISTATLLSAYEAFPVYFDTLHTNIPSSSKTYGKPTPDILNEAAYNIRWMLSMQDPDDGGVYNKCTNAIFDPMVMPDQARMTRYVVRKGTAAALNFAAVMAQASRLFKSFPELADLAKRAGPAATKAWRWACLHPAMPYDQDGINKMFDPKIVTGGYGDHQFTDEFFWAAAEMFKVSPATGKEYLDSLTAHISETFGLPTWSQTGLLGYYALSGITDQRLPGKISDTIRNRLVSVADVYLQMSGKNAFLTVMGGRKSDFNWGSNSNAANQGILLIRVYGITRDRKYLDAALGNLEYICGRNATGYCFVTGIGSFSPMHPHHRPSIADGIVEPVPGLLVGGPNPGMQDHCQYAYRESETAYTDVDCSYASNEIAINWNAPLVYLSNAIEALQNDYLMSK